MFYILSSAAVVIGALRVNYLRAGKISRLLIFKKKNLNLSSLKVSFVYTIKSIKQFVSRSDPTTSSGLIWVQTVCNGYQQTATAGERVNEPCR